MRLSTKFILWVLVFAFGIVALAAVSNLISPGNTNFPVYNSMFVVFFIIFLGAVSSAQVFNVQRRRRRRGIKPSCEALQPFVGKRCKITNSGAGGFSMTGVVESAQGKWLAMQTGKPGKQKLHMLNTDYIMYIREKSGK